MLKKQKGLALSIKGLKTILNVNSTYDLGMVFAPVPL